MCTWPVSVLYSVCGTVCNVYVKEATTQIYVLYIICLDTTELSNITTHNFALFYQYSQYRPNHYHIALFDTALKSVYTSIYCGSVLVEH